MSELELLQQKRKQVLKVLELCEFVFKDELGWTSADDTSYLNDADRANPDIMSNVQAMATTNSFVDGFGKDDTGHAGIWRATGHIVHLDTEGQYAIVARDVGDYLARAVGEEEFSAARDTLIAVGFKVSNDLDGIYETIKDAPDVNAIRHELYKAAQVERGVLRKF